MKMWHSKLSGRIRWSGGGLMVRKGQTIAENHPLRLERPDIFELRDVVPDIGEPDVVPDIEDADITEEPPVERGTRAPGEQRFAINGERRRPGRPRKNPEVAE